MEFLTTEQALDLLKQTAKQKNQSCEVMANEAKKFQASYQQKNLDQFGFSHTKQLGVRIVNEGREGVAYTENFSKESLLNTFDQASQNALTLRPEVTAALVKSSKAKPMPELFDARLEKVSVEEKLEAARNLETGAFKYDSRVKSLPYNGYVDVDSTAHIWSTEGVDGSYRSNLCYAYAYSLVQDGNDSTMAIATGLGKIPSELNTAKVGAHAAELAVKRLGAVQPKSGNYPVVLSEEAARTLFELSSHFFSAKSIFEKTSPLKTKIGDMGFSKELTVFDDPFYKNSMGARPFDSEGVPSQKTTVIGNGTLTNILSNSVYAKRMNIAHTANAMRGPSSDLSIGWSNLVVQPGTKTLSQLLDNDSDLIYVTELKGGHAGFNGVSGHFSLECLGEHWKNGKLISPLKMFVLSGNMLDVLRDIEGVGSEAEVVAETVISPALRVKSMSIAGN